MTKSTTSLFNVNQNNALAALGLPLWHKRSGASNQQLCCCYRLGQWLLIASEQLSVSKPQWLIDLALFLDTPLSELAEVSSRQLAAWPAQYQLHIMLHEGSKLSATCKRELWQHLAHHQ